MLLRIVRIAVLLTAGCAGAQTPPFCARIQSLTLDPSAAQAHWGISVTTLDGTPLCALNAAQLFRPASNAKLFTAAAALALLGPTRTFTTSVVVSSDALTPLPGGGFNPVLKGDLWLTGAGDANLSTRPLPYVAPGPAAQKRPDAPDPLMLLADAIAASGIRHVTGSIVGDDAIWPFEPYPPDWSIDDILWGYGAPVSALSVYDNKLKLTVTPGSVPGAAATVVLSSFVTPVLSSFAAGGGPASPTSAQPSFYELHAGVQTVAAKAPASIAVEREPGSKVIRVFGTVALGAPYTDDIAISNPPEFAALALKSMLEARGLQIDGVATSYHSLSSQPASFEHLATQPIPRLVAHPDAPPTCRFLSCTTLATHASPPLLEDLTLTLKVSQNLHAELLLHHLAESFGDDGSTAQGVRVIRQFALNAGLSPADFLLFDGSGLSGHDLVTPRSLTQLLVYAARQPWFPDFKAALPVGGVDGSLSARFPALKGRLSAKTGTLGESRALSGYLTSASGQTLVFSILVDTHTPLSTADRAIMDKIVEAIATQN